MYGIDILVSEHQNILKFTELLEGRLIEVLEGEDVDTNFFRRCIEFIRIYADNHHHKKEEDFLFVKMIEELDETAEKLVKAGMLVEHDLARYTVRELETSLKEYDESPNSKNKIDIIAHGMNYVYLLRRHIDKEDNVLYPFGEKNLSKESKDWIDKNTMEVEEKTEELYEEFKDIFDLL